MILPGALCLFFIARNRDTFFTAGTFLRSKHTIKTALYRAAGALAAFFICGDIHVY